MFDDVHLSPGLSVAAKAAVGEFLRNGVREGDRVSLLATSGAAWWNARMPEGREELQTVLKRLEGRYIMESTPDRVTEYEAMRIVEYDDPDVAYRVSQRFDAYGTARREKSDERLYRDTLDRSSVVGLIDPYVRGLAQRGRLHDQAGGFGEGHEEAARLGVGDGDRAAVVDLPQQRGHDAAATAEHVAETHDREARLAGARLPLAQLVEGRLAGTRMSGVCLACRHLAGA